MGSFSFTEITRYQNNNALFRKNTLRSLTKINLGLYLIIVILDSVPEIRTYRTFTADHSTSE